MGTNRELQQQVAMLNKRIKEIKQDKKDCEVLLVENQKTINLLKKELRTVKLDLLNTKADKDEFSNKVNLQWSDIGVLGERVKQLQRVNEKLRLELENERVEKKNLSLYTDDYIKKLRELEAKEDQYKTVVQGLKTQNRELLQKGKDAIPPDTEIVASGKTIELGPRKIREVLRLYVIDTTQKDIIAATGVSKGQLSRILTGNYTNKTSRKKILTAINRLLQVNQHPKTLEKLKALKQLYMDGGISDDQDRIN